MSNWHEHLAHVLLERRLGAKRAPNLKARIAAAARNEQAEQATLAASPQAKSQLGNSPKEPRTLGNRIAIWAAAASVVVGMGLIAFGESVWRPRGGTPADRMNSALISENTGDAKYPVAIETPPPEADDDLSKLKKLLAQATTITISPPVGEVTPLPPEGDPTSKPKLKGATITSKEAVDTVVRDLLASLTLSEMAAGWDAQSRWRIGFACGDGGTIVLQTGDLDQRLVDIRLGDGPCKTYEISGGFLKRIRLAVATDGQDVGLYGYSPDRPARVKSVEEAKGLTADVTHVMVRAPGIKPETIKALAHLSQLEWLDLSCLGDMEYGAEQSATDEVLLAVAQLEGLAYELTNDINRKSGLPITPFTQHLRYLDLSYSPFITDDSLAYLASAKTAKNGLSLPGVKLETLKLLGCPKLSNRSLEYIGFGLCELRVLDLRTGSAKPPYYELQAGKSEPVQPPRLLHPLSHFSGLSQLEEIHLDEWLTTDESVKILAAEHPNLRVLSVTAREETSFWPLNIPRNVRAKKYINGISDESLRLIRVLTCLESLSFVGCCHLVNKGITPAGIAEHLATLPRLKTLDVCYNENILTDEGLKAIAHIASLESINISGTWHIDRTVVPPVLTSSCFTDAGLESLKALTNLHSLEMAGNIHVTSKGIAALTGSPLRSLDVTMCPLLGDTSLAEIAKIQTLESLVCLGGLNWKEWENAEPVTHDGWMRLAALQHLKMLNFQLGGPQTMRNGEPKPDIGQPSRTTIQALRKALPECRIYAP